MQYILSEPQIKEISGITRISNYEIIAYHLNHRKSAVQTNGLWVLNKKDSSVSLLRLTRALLTLAHLTDTDGLMPGEGSLNCSMDFI